MELWRRGKKNSFQVLLNSWIVIVMSLNLLVLKPSSSMPMAPDRSMDTDEMFTKFHFGNLSSSSLHNHQADQPVHNNNNSSGSNNGSPPPTTPPPSPPSNNQTYRHQEDLKALSQNITNILNSFDVTYDKRVRPNYGGEAVEVGITMYVLSVSALSEVEMDFTVDFYFRQMWKDHRLAFQGPPGVNNLALNSEFLKSIWVPDTFFVNEKYSYFHTAVTANELVRISEMGDILKSTRLTVRARCPMDFRLFPMDTQLCTIDIESFGYTMSDIRYKWAAGLGSVGISSDVTLPQFKVQGYRLISHEISLSTGNYSRLALEIQFVRSTGYYLIQTYLPSSIIVVISWVSFWLSRAAVTARVFLGITTVLTMTTLMYSTHTALPKISYVKSIDVYLGICFVMVFAALLEYATVGYLAKRIQMHKQQISHQVSGGGEASSSEEQRDGESRSGTTGHKIRQLIPISLNRICGITPGDLDKYSRVVFPVCFAGFNLLYWITYLRLSNVNLGAGLVELNPEG